MLNIKCLNNSVTT